MASDSIKQRGRIVQISDYKPRRLTLERDTYSVAKKTQRVEPAIIVSMRDRVGCFASVEIDELSALTPGRQRHAVMQHVRKQLALEFGQLRITQHHRSFTVRHRDVEEMIGGLLRVQYHVFQCSVAELTSVQVPESFVGLHLTWGVGSTLLDADSERLKRRRRKRFREDN